jgi:formylglycine-generating enzyme required for sulfatase activity
MNYLDFDLAIESVPGAPATYRARVLHSPAGQATVDFTLPFSAHELENYILKMGRPRRQTRSLSQEGEAARELGARLYNAVFQQEVRDALRRSLDAADAKPDQGLRLRLRLGDAPALLDLPWEYLYDPALRRFFCHSVATPLVRYPEQPRPVTPLAVTLPLQVLVMIANPSDVSTLDVESEWQKIEVALAPLVAQGQVQLTRLSNATLAALQRQLRQGSYHIFHFVGHGGVSPINGERVLYLEDERGRARLVSGDTLGTLLNDHRSLRLALLNACEGARVGTSDPFAGVAQHLVLQGIPAIIAMQFEITDDAALLLAQEFYAALADGYPVEAALAEARKAIFVAGHEVEWGTPVLYSRASDGLLFNVDPKNYVAAPPVIGTTAGARETASASATNLPGRGEDDSQNKEPSVAPSRKVDDARPAQAKPAANPIARDEERIAKEKEQAERVAKHISQDDVKSKSVSTTIPSTTKRRNWWMISLVVVGVPLLFYLSISGYNAYETSQQPIRATATAERLQAMATTLAPQISATATAMVNTDSPKLLQLSERFGIKFVPVSGGSFMMGNPAGIGYGDEQPAHEIQVTNFWIGLTEVTNAQYQHFIVAKGYDNQEWWTDAGWQWRTENNITTPEYWSDENWNGANQPVVGVSWYEAKAYVTWLAAETGLVIDLPTEAQWEKAARGIDGRIYPWGDESPDDQRSNYGSNVGKTVDVGNYAAGASPYGALDMAGNVWEWTATKWVSNYENYATMVDNDKAGDAARALRGGSWYHLSYNVRSANRFRSDPLPRFDELGFRVVFAPGG